MVRFGGYVITRKLYDDNDKLRNFTFYPAKYGGNPPYLYKTKEKAMKVLKTKRGIFGGKEFTPEKNKVVKFTKSVYLNRWDSDGGKNKNKGDENMKRKVVRKATKGKRYMRTRAPAQVMVKGYSRSKDKMYVAKKVGRRVSKSGKVYYEYRVNRSDKNRKKRL